MEPLYNYPGTEVPLEHMDYGYVTKCTNIKELGKILKVLRSGKEGNFPELIEHTERRLAELDPTNKLLIKNKPAARMSDLPHEELTALNKDLEEWQTSVSNTEVNGGAHDDDSELPPVRVAGAIDKTVKLEGTKPAENGSSQERIKSYDFDGWSKYDVEKESAQVDNDKKKQPPKPRDPVIPSQLSERERSMPGSDKVKMADREREKGNEAFRAGDHEEALVYYTRSLQFSPSVAAYNNKALTEIKLKQFQAAVDDCTHALKMDPGNTKALFRRGTAYSQLDQGPQAATDFERVLHFEPNNKKAQQELSALRQKLGEDQKVKKKRLVIEEVEGETPLLDSTDGVQDKSAPVEQPKPIIKEPPPNLPTKVQRLKDDGNTVFKSGNYSGALDKYTQAIDTLTRNMDHSQEPNLSMLLNNRAACQLKIGNCSAAIEDCTHSLSLVPVNVKALMRRAQAYEHLEKYKRAYNDYQLALSIDRSLISAYQASSRITRLLRDLEGNGWRNKLPEVKEASLIREMLMSQTTQPADSAATSKKTAESATLSAETKVPDVAVSDDSAITSEPITVTTSQETKVTQSTPPLSSPRPATPPKPSEELLAPEDLFEKHKLKGNEHIKKGEYVEALRCYSLCVDACPDNVVGYTNRALCHLKLNSPRSAEADCDKALSLDPRSVKALYRRALAKKALDRYAEAVKDLHQLTTVDPDNSIAKRELAEVKQLWEKQLREIQAKATAGKKDTRAERRAKSKSAKKASSTEDADKSPAASLQSIQKLLEELKASKEKMEELSKSSPGSGAEAPPQQSGAGKQSSPTMRAPPTPASPTTKGASPVQGKGTTKSKTKKKPKQAKTENPKPNPVKVKESKPAEDSKTKNGPTVKQDGGLKSPTVKQDGGLKSPTVKQDGGKKGKRIVIQEANSSSEDDKPAEITPLPVKPDSSETTPLPVTPIVQEDDKKPAAPLKTPFEFVQRWNAIPRTAKSADYARLLETIAPSSLPSVVTTKLDGMMLTNIIRAIDKQFIPNGKYELSVDILTNLSKVPRFGMVAMFMGPQEKSDLNNVLSKMAASEVPTSSIDNLRKLYTIN